MNIDKEDGWLVHRSPEVRTSYSFMGFEKRLKRRVP